MQKAPISTSIQEMLQRFLFHCIISLSFYPFPSSKCPQFYHSNWHTIIGVCQPEVSRSFKIPTVVLYENKSILEHSVPWYWLCSLNPNISYGDVLVKNQISLRTWPESHVPRIHVQYTALSSMQTDHLMYSKVTNPGRDLHILTPKISSIFL